MTTVPIFGDMMRLLLEGTPIDSVDTIKLFEAIIDIDFVEELHDFHVWELAPDKPIMTAHVVIKQGMSHKLALAELTALV
jgi:cobalt-zinc-cadmium efflux system protein